jgi:hypothetical protein
VHLLSYDSILANFTIRVSILQRRSGDANYVDWIQNQCNFFLRAGRSGAAGYLRKWLLDLFIIYAIDYKSLWKSFINFFYKNHIF